VIPPTAREEEVEVAEERDVRKFFAALKESGLDGLSHEDGWTLMHTDAARALRTGLDEARSLGDALAREAVEAWASKDELRPDDPLIVAAHAWLAWHGGSSLSCERS
jgi:hypothetical protein